jgi:hypothetical protein
MPGTVSHPLIHGDRGWFADNRDGELPVLRGTVLRVRVEHLPDGRKPHKTMWLWHAGPAPLSCDELWRAYLARFDEEHAFIPRGSARLLHDVALARHVPGSATDLRGCGARGW